MQASSPKEEAATDAKIWSTLESVLRPKFGTVSGQVEKLDESEYHAALSEAYAKVKQRIESPDIDSVDDLEAYSAAVAHNVFKKLLKRKYPVRFKLADEVKNTLELDPRLAYWKMGRTGIGGKKAWDGQPIRLGPNGKLTLEDPVRAADRCFQTRAPASLLTSDLLLIFFEWLKYPFGYDSTVNFCFASLGLREMEVSPAEPCGAEPADTRHRPEEAADARALAEFIWVQCKQLDDVRRGVLLMFEPPGENQEAISDQLIAHGACTLSELATAVGISFDQFAELRQHGRITYEVVGKLYGLTAKQAENIRRGVTELLCRRLVADGYQQERKG